MALTDFSIGQDSVELLQRSLGRGRLGHAYLFHGADLEQLENVARALAKTLNCEKPKRRPENEQPVDCCDACPSCQRIDNDNHPDITWLRPESKLRVIKIEQIRELLQLVYLKPTIAPVKVAVLVAADRLNVQAANAFLKTLEEPPEDSVLILLTTEPQRILDTIRSRCLRLSFGGDKDGRRDPGLLSWLKTFSEAAAQEHRSLLGRYQLLSVLLKTLNEVKGRTEESLTQQSPLEIHVDVDPKLKEKWEVELVAAIEAEYRRQRLELLTGLHWWLRDVWFETLQLGREMLTYPELGDAARAVARRLSPRQAMDNLQILEQTQRLLFSNVQEALALEVGLLKLKL
jgi:DNA polymerase-3 subunit delta'